MARRSKKKKKSSPSIHTYYEDRSQTDNSMLVKIVLLILVAGGGYYGYQNYIAKPAGNNNVANNDAKNVDNPPKQQDNGNVVPIDNGGNSQTVVIGNSNNHKPNNGNQNNNTGNSNTGGNGSQNNMVKNSNNGNGTDDNGNNSTDNTGSDKPKEDEILVLATSPRTELIDEPDMLELIQPSYFVVTEGDPSDSIEPDEDVEMGETTTTDKAPLPGYQKVMASGIVISKDGYALTSLTGLKNMAKCYAKFNDGKTIKIAGVLHADALYDIALIKLETGSNDNLTPVPLAEQPVSEKQRIHSFYLNKEHKPVPTAGYISGIRDSRDMKFAFDLDFKGKWLQHTIPFTSQTLGAGIFDSKGNLLGLSTRCYSLAVNNNLGVSAESIKEFITTSRSKTLETFVDISTSLIKYQMGTLPTVYQQRSAINLIDTPIASKLLAEIDEFRLVPTHYSMTQSGHPINKSIEISFTTYLKTQDVYFITDGSSRSDEPTVYYTIYTRKPKRSSQNLLEIRCMAECIVYSADLSRYVKVWETEDLSLGTLTQENFDMDVVTKAFDKTSREAATKFRSAIIKAKREYGIYQKQPFEEQIASHGEKYWHKIEALYTQEYRHCFFDIFLGDVQTLISKGILRMPTSEE